MPNCTSCGAPGAYLGFNTVECKNPECKHFAIEIEKTCACCGKAESLCGAMASNKPMENPCKDLKDLVVEGEEVVNPTFHSFTMTVVQRAPNFYSPLHCWQGWKIPGTLDMNSVRPKGKPLTMKLPSSIKKSLDVIWKEMWPEDFFYEVIMHNDLPEKGKSE
jgi:hypothetical protein